MPRVFLSCACSDGLNGIVLPTRVVGNKMWLVSHTHTVYVTMATRISNQLYEHTSHKELRLKWNWKVAVFSCVYVCVVHRNGCFPFRWNEGKSTNHKIKWALWFTWEIKYWFCQRKRHTYKIKHEWRQQEKEQRGGEWEKSEEKTILIIIKLKFMEKLNVSCCMFY